MGLTGWPTVTDDDGSYAVGTVFNKALTDAMLASIEADLFSAANPAVTCENIIDEVVAARGSKTDLDTRLDVSMNEDGTLKTQSGIATTANLGGQIQNNWVVNDIFDIWAAGDAVAPTGWFVDTVAVARSQVTTALGGSVASLTRSGTDGNIQQSLIKTTDQIEAIRGKKFAFGAWIITQIAGQGRLLCGDGVVSSASSYHDGDGTWQWITGTITANGSASRLDIRCEVKNFDGAVAFQGVTVVPGEVVPTRWIPAPRVLNTHVFTMLGAITTGASKAGSKYTNPVIGSVVDTKMIIATAPTGADLIVDINQYDGSAWTSMYATKPTIAIGSTRSVLAEPDGGYQYRGFEAGYGVSPDRKELNVDVDQIGSGVAGSNLSIHIRVLEYHRPQQSLLEVDSDPGTA